MSAKNLNKPGYDPSAWANKRKVAMDRAIKKREDRKNSIDPESCTFKPTINKNSSGNRPPDIKPHGWQEPDADSEGTRGRGTGSGMPPDALDELNASASRKGGAAKAQPKQPVFSAGDDIPIKPAAGGYNFYANAASEQGGGGLGEEEEELTKVVKQRKDVRVVKPPADYQQKPRQCSSEMPSSYGELDAHSNFDDDQYNSKNAGIGRRQQRDQMEGGYAEQEGSTAPLWNHKHTRVLPGDPASWQDDQKNTSHLNGMQQPSGIPRGNLSLLKKKLSSRGPSRSRTAEIPCQFPNETEVPVGRAKTTPPRNDICDSEPFPAPSAGAGGFGGKLEPGNSRANPSANRPPRRRPQPQQDREEEMMSNQERMFGGEPAQPSRNAYPPGGGQQGYSKPVPQAQPQPQQAKGVRRPRPGSSSSSRPPSPLQLAAPDGGVVDTELFPCADCGRKFNSNALAKHQKICKKVFLEQRKQFNVQAQRLVSEEQAKLLKQAKREETKAKKIGASKPAEEQPIKGSKAAKWKTQSDQLREAMKAQRMIAKAQKDGIPLSQIPMAPSSAPDPSLIECPTCGRRFNQQAAERHIPKCATIVNKPKTLQRGTRPPLGTQSRSAAPEEVSKARRNKLLKGK